MNTPVNKYTNITPVEIAKLHLNDRTISLEQMVACKMKDYAIALQEIKKGEILFNVKIFSNTGKNSIVDNIVVEDTNITINNNLLNSHVVKIKAENVTNEFVLKLKKIATRYRDINAELFLYYLLDLFKEMKQSFTVSFLLGVEAYEFEFDYKSYSVNFGENQLYVHRELDTITFTEVDRATGIIRELATVNNIKDEASVVNCSLSSFLAEYGSYVIASIIKHFTLLANASGKVYCLKNVANIKYSTNYLKNKGFSSLVYYDDNIAILPDNCGSLSTCELSYKNDRDSDTCSASIFTSLDEILSFYNSYDFSTDVHILKLTSVPEYAKTAVTNELKRICKEGVKLIVIE